MKNINNLYKALLDNNLLTISFDEFLEKYKNEEYKQQVFKAVTQEKLFTKDYETFSSAYSLPQTQEDESGSGVINFLGDLFDFLGDLFGFLGEIFVGEIFVELFDFLGDLFDFLGEIFVELFDFIGELFVAIINFLGQSLVLSLGVLINTMMILNVGNFGLKGRNTILNIVGRCHAQKRRSTSLCLAVVQTS